MALANDSRIPVKDIVRDADNNPTTQTATYEVDLGDLAEFINESGGGGTVTWDDVEDKPASFPPETPIDAGDIDVAAYADGGISAGNLQAVLEALADRIDALEP